MDGTTNNSFRVWRFCLITSTHSCSYFPLRIPHVMTIFLSVSFIDLFASPSMLFHSIHLSIVFVQPSGWMSLLIIFILRMAFFFYSPYLLCSACVELFISHYIDVSTLYTSAHSNSGLPLLRTPKGLSMLPFHLCLFSLP